jgi:hypothetical protein
MNEEQIVDFWSLLKEYVDKKHIEVVAEKYIDMLADYGVSDETLKESLGSDSVLDEAIGYYLEIDADAFIEDYNDEWE